MANAWLVPALIAVIAALVGFRIENVTYRLGFFLFLFLTILNLLKEGLDEDTDDKAEREFRMDRPGVPSQRKSTLRVCTFNLRFLLDSYALREEFMLDTLAETEADVFGLQECALGSWFGTHNLIRAKLLAHGCKVDYFCSRTALYVQRAGFLGRLVFNSRIWPAIFDIMWLFNRYLGPEVVFGRHSMAVFNHSIGKYVFALTGAAFIFGNTIVAKTGYLMSCRSSLLLGSFRLAQRALVTLSCGRRVWIVNTHLVDGRNASAQAKRAEQVRKILAWMDLVTKPEDKVAGVVFTGDFNADPDEPAAQFWFIQCAGNAFNWEWAYRVFEQAGYASGFKQGHGKEPEYTFPSGIQSTSMERPERNHVFDYIFFKGSISVAPESKPRVVGNKPLKANPNIFPSDHLGVVVDFVVG